MPLISITYHQDSRVFTATDENGNQVNFRSTPNGSEAEAMAARSIGVRPMQSLLMALGTCSGIDVVAILEKQRQEYSRLELKISGEREAGTVPSLWTKAHIEFILDGPLNPDKVNRAVALSIDKYCSVAETLRRAGCAVTYTTNLNHAS